LRRRIKKPHHLKKEHIANTKKDRKRKDKDKQLSEIHEKKQAIRKFNMKEEIISRLNENMGKEITT
jgi:hypothetical protein